MRKLTTEDFIKKSRIVHDNKYSYSKTIYNGMRKEIIITCKKHGDFTQNAGVHINGKSGCKKCDLESRSKKRTSSTEEFIKKARKKHSDIYDYSQVLYKNNSTKVKIACQDHGVFLQLPSNHLSGSGCKKCAQNKSAIEKSLKKEEFIKQAQKIHGNKYDYSKVEYKNNRTKVIITCRDHGDFLQTPDAHLNHNQGCPHCRESKGERKIANFLEEDNIQFNRQKRFNECINPKTGRKLPFDFYIPSINMCIEFDGLQHFRPIKRFGGEKGYKDTIYRDNIKNSFCAENSIRLLRIKYNDKIVKKLKNNINGNI